MLCYPNKCSSLLRYVATAVVRRINMLKGSWSKLLNKCSILIKIPLLTSPLHRERVFRDWGRASRSWGPPKHKQSRWGWWDDVLSQGLDRRRWRHWFRGWIQAPRTTPGGGGTWWLQIKTNSLFFPRSKFSDPSVL